MDGMMLRAWEAWTLFFITTIVWAIVQKLFVPLSQSDVVHTQSSWMCASLLSTWGYCGVEQFISNGTKYACDVKLIARGILARQSPQAAPQHFRLNILTWFLTNLSCLVICVVPATSRAYWSCWLNTGCIYELPPSKWRHVALFSWTWAQRSAIDKSLMTGMIEDIVVP